MKYFFAIGICLLLYTKGWSKTFKDERLSNRENSLLTVRKKFDALRQKNKSMLDEYNKRSINLDSLPQFSPFTPEVPAKSSPIPLPLEEIVSEKNPNLIALPINRIGFYLGACFPHSNTVAFQGNPLEVKYSTGANLQFAYQRLYNRFFWGIGLDAKIFDAEEITRKTGKPYPISGKNSLMNFFASIGYEHPFYESFFLSTELSLGYSLSKRNLALGSNNTGDSFYSSLYYGFTVGPGIRFGDYWGMIYYRIDGINETGNYNGQLISQIGLQLAVQY